jgi:hypothetical protein
MTETNEKKKVEARISINKNKITVDCPRHYEVLAESKSDFLKDGSILVESGEKECRRCKDTVYFWYEVDATIFRPKE